MNKIFTITTALLLVVTSTTLHAKNGIEPMLTVGVNTGNTFPHFGPVVGGDKGAVFKTNHRLISKVYYKHSGNGLQLVDSTTYSYNNGRAGAIDLERPNDDQNILFDNSYTYNYDNTLGDYGNRMHRNQQFVDNKVTMLTYTPWTYTSNGWTWKDSLRYIYQYSADGKMTKSASEKWYGTLWDPIQESVLSYNSSNNIVNMRSLNYEVVFTYNSNNKIEQVVDKRLNGGFTLENSERKTYTYVGNEIATYELETWNTLTSTWDKTVRWEYTYVAGTDKLSVEAEYEWVNNTWTKTRRTNYTYDSNDNLTEKLKERWDASLSQYVNYKRETWQYNVDDLPVLLSRQTWTGSSWGYAYGDEEIHYRYERYFPTSVNTIANSSKLNVYPVPAATNVVIDWDNHYNYNISVVDMTGRVVMNSTSANNGLSVNSLPNGNYFVRVTDGADKMMKQIVVAH